MIMIIMTTAMIRRKNKKINTELYYLLLVSGNLNLPNLWHQIGRFHSEKHKEMQHHTFHSKVLLHHST